MPRWLRVEIVGRRVRGERLEQIASSLGVAVRTVSRVIADAGGMPPPRPWAHRSPYRLSRQEREEIGRGLVAGESLRVIAARLGRAPSTISREVAANGGRHAYRAWRSDEAAWQRARRPKPTVFERNPRLASWVEEHLALRWSPRQIAASLVVDFADDEEMRVSHETIYQTLFVQARGGLRKDLTACLRSGRTTRRPQHRAARTPGARIPEMVMISQRPAEIEDRAVPGHWEGDLIMGAAGRSAIATLVERSTRFVLLCALPGRHTTLEVTAALQAQIQTLPAQLARSITWDQGTEMAGHRQFTIATGIPVYFCDPHSPWQRGSNENTNGLLRQYFPKGTDLSIHTQTDLDHVAAELNGRPRQTLGWMPPSRKLAELVALTA